MMSGDRFRKYTRDQRYLLPLSMKDWLPEGHPAWFVIDAVKEIDLDAFYEGYSADGSGNIPYDPELMVTLLLFAYTQGIRSSRQIENKCQQDVAFRIVAANQQPDHVTIARFRKAKREKIHELFIEILRLCREAGLGKLGKVAVDGTKIAANAALDANRTKDGLEKEVKKILDEADAIDEEEDRKYGRDRRGDELPEELRHQESRLVRLREAKARLEKEAEKAREKQREKITAREKREEKAGKPLRGRKPLSPDKAVDGESKANVTDPESRIMKTRKGFIQGYNAQLVASQDQLILAANLTQEENDQHQWRPMMGEMRRNLKATGRENKVKAALGDAGYANEALLRKPPRGMEIFLSTQKDYRRRQEIREQGSPRGRIPSHLSHRERMERKLQTKRGQQFYKQRGMIVEATIGQVKTCTGCNQFMCRGVENARSEWRLACSAHNLLKLFRSGKAHWC
jgi:transposase